MKRALFATADRLARLLERAMCAVGLHGPNLYRTGSYRNQVQPGFLTRRCASCGAIWHGWSIQRGAGRVIDWRRKP